jgi:hypothetical protein
MKFYVKIALFVVLVIAISGILYGLYLFNLKHPDTAKAKPDFVITSTVLQKEFEDNEKAASAKYINKILEVTGIIVSVTPVDSANTNISLNTGNNVSSVICTFPVLDHSKIKIGEEITLHGECSGFTQLFPGEPPLDVLINNCSKVPKRK